MPPGAVRAAEDLRDRAIEAAPPRDAGRSRAVFADVLDADGNPASLVEGVRDAHVSLVCGPPRQTATQIAAHLLELGLLPEFLGRTRCEGDESRPVAVFRGVRPPTIGPAPPSFRVVAIIVAYNEQDVIATTVDHLVREGLDVYLVDNWSTDDTLDLARQAGGPHLIGWERFPSQGPTGQFDLSEHVRRIQVIATEFETSWIVLNDADEIRYAPWAAVSLRDALYHVQEEGFSAVNYTALNFALTPDSLDLGMGIEDRIQWFAPERIRGLGRLNTWQQPRSEPVELVSSGSHTVSFAGRKVFPFNFLMKHYPIRSIEQGLRKINLERIPRYPIDERLRGWHGHYRHVGSADLVRSPAELVHFDERFMEDFLLERLVGFDAGTTPVTFTLKAARALHRVHLLSIARRLKWRLSP